MRYRVGHVVKVTDIRCPFKFGMVTHISPGGEYSVLELHAEGSTGVTFIATEDKMELV